MAIFAAWLAMAAWLQWFLKNGHCCGLIPLAFKEMFNRLKMLTRMFIKNLDFVLANL
jgi:hypothetical protein